MPLTPVPFHETTSPRHRVVPAGTLLWRVTKQPPGSAAGDPDAPPLFWPGSYEPSLSRPRRGGRFDPCRQHTYSYSYMALDDLTALAETLLRDTVFNGERRPLMVEQIRDRRLTLLEARRDLTLISLVSLQDLAAARQDTWLVHAEEDQYSLTRCWGHWLRECSQAADGIVWRSKRNPDGRAVMLFGERCGEDVTLSSLGHRLLDDPPGLDWLNRRLSLVQSYVVPADVDKDAEVGIA